MTNKYSLVLTTAMTIGLLLWGARPINAQTVQVQPKPVNETYFDEVVVVARKRSENIQDTPLSISAFSAEIIENAGIRDMADIAKLTPGFTLDDEFGRINGVRPVMRGQATILGASGVSTFVDGILLNGSILDYDLTDVEQVEVVKGPQSALYGRNTYSGAINIITKSPTDETTGDIKLEAGKFGRAEMAGSVRGPISDTVSASLHGRWFKRGGPFTNSYNGEDVGQQNSLAASLALYYEPTDRLSARARVRLSKLHDDQPRLFQTDPRQNNVFIDEGGTYLGNGRYFAGEITEQAIAYDDERQLGEKGYEDVRSGQASLTINYQLNDQIDLEFINGVNGDIFDSKFDFDNTATSLAPFGVYIGPVFPFTGPHFFHAYVLSDPADFASVSESWSHDHSHELRFNYDSNDQWKTMLGGYYYQGKSRSEGTRQAPAALREMVTEGFAAQQARMEAQCAAHANDTFAPCFTSPFFESIINFGSDLEELNFSADRGIRRSNRRNLALFGSADWEADSLALTLEGRYKSERITNRSIERSAVYNLDGTQINFLEKPEVEREATFESFNPRLSARYRIADHTNLYGVVARGDKPGGFNTLNAASVGFGTYDEETVWAYELGMKNTFLDGGYVLNLAGFHNTIDDYQLTQAITIPGNASSSAITNVGKVRVRGLEADLTYRSRVVPALVVTASYALADTKILRGTDLNEGRHLDVADDGRLNCSVGLEDPSLACSADNVRYGSIEGRQLPRSPKHTVSLGMNYNRPLTDTMDIVFGSTLSYESKKYVQVHNLAYVGANTLLSANIGLETDTMSVSVWGRNLTNEDAVVSAQRFIDPNRSFQRAFGGNPRVPREWGVTVRKHF